ncbi:MAG TPA: hypothetical protein VNI61_06080 [Gemmatimonadales bacterium]|nr:hypothetical protein [Gemmatimonadales bacterium]
MDPTDPIQFEHAEHLEGVGAGHCARCGQSLGACYYEVNGRLTCDACKAALEAEREAGTSVGRLVRATLLGALAAGAGFGLYYAILTFIGMELSLVSLIVGVMVGSAVKRGSSGRGGRVYQALAVFLTYSVIVASYAPFVVQAAREGTPAPAVPASGVPTAADTTAAARPGAGPAVLGVLVALAVLYAAPVVAGVDNVLALIIILIGLAVAWKTAERSPFVVTGPYRVATA